MTELYINRILTDLPNDIDVTVETLLFDPTKTVSSSGEFSYTIRIPRTPQNSIAFGFADVISQHDKYSRRYDTRLYQDSVLIFSGDAILTGTDSDSFSINLVNKKIDGIDDIFGDETMNEIDWKIPYEGYTTINQMNAQPDSPIYFPLVCYGAFQKKPVLEYEGGYERYNSLYVLDNRYSQWYEESFIPTPNYLSLVRKLFDNKGISAEGDIFADVNARKIYLSSYLDSGQQPTYNLGGDLGKVTVNYSFTNKSSSTALSDNYLTQELEYKYGKLDAENYNYDTVRTYDVFTHGTVTDTNHRLFHDNCIVAPADGLYSIDLSYTASIAAASMQMDVYKKKLILSDNVTNYQNPTEVVQYKETIYRNWDNFPIEVHLIRNSDNVELIHGNVETSDIPYSIYPHSYMPKNMVNVRRGQQMVVGEQEYPYGYTSKDGEMIAYDAFASQYFICGGTSNGNHGAVIRNGHSWNALCEEVNYSRYPHTGYWGVTQKRTATGGVQRAGYSYQLSKTQNCSNTLPDSTYTVTRNGDTMTLHVQCIVALKRNDVLSLKAVTREYVTKPDDYVSSKGINEPRTATSYTDDYRITLNGTLSVNAYSPRTDSIINSDAISWNSSPYPFDTQLNIGEFMSSTQKKADFIKDFMKVFNLTSHIEGNTIQFIKQKDYNVPMYAVDIDSCTVSHESQMIEYPRTMSVRFASGDTEAGFYASVPKEHIDDYDWKNYADVGYDTVDMGGDINATESSVTLQMGYDWFGKFRYETYQQGSDTPTTSVDISIPVIAEDRYFIDGGDIGEYMKHDGRSLRQRMFYRGGDTLQIPLTHLNGNVNAVIPENVLATGNHVYTLDYRNRTDSLLDTYYNIGGNTSYGYEIVSCVLTAEQYALIRGGAHVRFNSDTYRVCKAEYSLNDISRLYLIKY